MTKVSIIIRAYNEARHIGKLLQTIAEQEVDCPVETILVDSGSTDDTRKIAKQFQVKIVRITPESFSFGYALNQGIAAANGQFMLFISAHCYPQSNTWIREMIKPFKDPQVGLVYGMQRGNPQSRFSEHQIFAQWFPDEPEPTTDFPFCNNANTAIRRSLWEQHPYNEELTGLEDIAWAKDLVSMGHKISYKSSAAIIHIHDERFSQVRNRYRREAIAFKHIFPHAHFSILDFIKLLTINVANDWVKAILQKRFKACFQDIPAFRVAQFWGTYLGHRKKDRLTKELRMKMYYPSKGRKQERDPKTLVMTRVKGENSKP